ncbi:hypothetical protein I6L58_21635 [Enterobacter cancerogenus]|uniref:Prophage protein n=1 Tax=Enterobacter cancerogenus TaxID=69218 RepID=A0ABX8KKC6_9ENTR|nr:hypothetical protein [Enterobacter cancerogenus]QXA49248.1 hypothetical protein I6L58_21635 [Enterobacter cancerogenus]
MTANKFMTGEQLDELMTVAVNMQRDSEKSGDRPTAMFAYAVQVAVLELRKVRNHAAKIPETSMSIARYWISPNGIACEDNEGKFVRYEDYAVLEARCTALAAENAGLKDWSPNPHSASMFEAIEKAEQLMDDGMPELAMVEAFEILKLKRTQATDAYLAEVRAQAVDMCSAEIQKQTWDEREGDGIVAAIDAMEIYALQLRKGVQS